MWQLTLCETLYRLDDIAAAHARQRCAVNRGSGEHVVPDDLRRAGRVAHLCDRPEWHHVAVSVAHLDLLDVRGIGAKWGVGLNVYLPGAAEAVEVVDVVTADV